MISQRTQTRKSHVTSILRPGWFDRPRRTTYSRASIISLHRHQLTASIKMDNGPPRLRSYWELVRTEVEWASECGHHEVITPRLLCDAAIWQSLLRILDLIGLWGPKTGRWGLAKTDCAYSSISKLSMLSIPSLWWYGPLLESPWAGRWIDLNQMQVS